MSLTFPTTQYRRIRRRSVRNSWFLALAGGLISSSAMAATETAGTPWIGERGVTETVAQIMERQRNAPRIEGLRMRPEFHVNRRDLPLDPDSPQVSQWPPPDQDPDEPKKDDEVDPNVPAPPGDEPDMGNPGGEPGHPGHNGPLYNPQIVGTNFLAIQLSESGAVPPDSVGAVGPTQIMVALNGRIKVFDKNGSLGPLNASDNTFWNSVRNGSGVSDPQVRFDRISQRWMLSAFNLQTPNRIMIAISSGPTISNLASFTFFFFVHDAVGTTPNSDTGGVADYVSLGVDANALYLGGNIFNAAGTMFIGTTGYVVQKSSVTGGGPIVVTPFRQLATAGGQGPWSPRGVDNDDATATQGYFIGVSNTFFGQLVIRRVSNPGTTPSISGNLIVSVPTTNFPENAPHMGSANDLDALDDRLFQGHVRKNKFTGVSTLWTAHNIEVNSAGVASGTGNRDGSRWYQLGNLTAAPNLVQSGTLFDSAAVNPKFYFIPSITMSGQGHAALGCTYSAANEHAGVAVAGRLSGDAPGTIQAPTVALDSNSAYNVEAVDPQRWGDYSETTIDPTDDMTMWTFQEYCNAANSWAVRVTKLLAPPPAQPTSAVPNQIEQGQSNLNIAITGASTNGSGFFDPDGTFPNHIAASVAGVGVTVNSVTFTDPTHITLNVSASPTATLGQRIITVTNPDGQQALSPLGIVTVIAPTVACLGDIAPVGGNDQVNVDDLLALINAWGPCP